MFRESDKPTGGADNEIVVFSVVRDSKCTECGKELWKGSLLRLDGEKACCMRCAGLDALEYLPSGDAALTRRAGKYSKRRVVVVQWSRSRKRYERQGLLVEAEALRRAEEETTADAPVRAQRNVGAAKRRVREDRQFVTAFASAIRQQYPGCPPDEAAAIAEHACRKYSGRVGRTAAAKELSPKALRLAVVAHIRHAHTEYDELLARYGDRDSAREETGHLVSAILETWQQGGAAEDPE